MHKNNSLRKTLEKLNFRISEFFSLLIVDLLVRNKIKIVCRLPCKQTLKFVITTTFLYLRKFFNFLLLSENTLSDLASFKYDLYWTIFADVVKTRICVWPCYSVKQNMLVWLGCWDDLALNKQRATFLRISCNHLALSQTQIAWMNLSQNRHNLLFRWCSFHLTLKLEPSDSLIDWRIF
jgi:hypothetical protein